MNDDFEEPIPIAVPVIIDKDRFLRIGVSRADRSPRKTPPLHVTPRTLLTGLCRCGYCGSSMHISTGKSGRYRYLKCNRRNSVSNTDCASPNVPYEKFEKLVIASISEYVLTDSHLEAILSDCKQNVDKLSASQGSERAQLLEMKVTLDRKLKNLYKLVEDAKIKVDASLGSRLQGWQDDLKTVQLKLKSLKVPVLLPKGLVESIDLPDFRASVLSVLNNPLSDEAKSFTHLVIEEIRIYADEATVSGANLGVLEAALTHKREAVPTVPSFMSNWRRGRDSNPR